jgi:hypothetical protein
VPPAAPGPLPPATAADDDAFLLVCDEAADECLVDDGVAVAVAAHAPQAAAPVACLTSAPLPTGSAGPGSQAAAPLAPARCAAASPPASLAARLRALSAALPPPSLAAAYGYSPLAIAVGACYFSRLAAAAPGLASAAATCGCRELTALAAPAATAAAAASAGDPPPSPSARTFGFGAKASAASAVGSGAGPATAAASTRARLAAVYLACVHVAAKNVDTVPYRCLLATMLANLCGVEGVSPAAAAALELDVLVGLGWRLGPFFSPAVEVAYK